jgi:AbrB family looped-hinge helix DNA binding protein
MDVATVSSRYQIIIPRKVREQFNLKPGQKIVFIPYRNSIRLVIIPPIEESLGIFSGINTENLREEVDEER